MRKLFVAVVVLVVLGVAADRLALAVSTRAAQERLANEGFTQPELDVAGFPFLTQLLRREFDDVSLSADAVAGQQGRVTNVHGRALDLAVHGDHRVDVGRLTATGTVPYGEVLDAVGRPSLRLHDGPANRVRVSRSATVLGQTVTLSGTASVEAQGTALRVTARSVSVSGSGAIDGSLTQGLSDRLSFTYRVRGLPDGVRITHITTNPRGFVVHLTGRDLSFTNTAV